MAARRHLLAPLLAAACFEDPGVLPNGDTGGGASSGDTLASTGAEMPSTSQGDGGTTAADGAESGSSESGPVGCAEVCFSGECDADGRCERIVFVTLEIALSDFGGRESADSICQSEADDAGLEGRSFRAYLAGPGGPMTASDPLAVGQGDDAKFVLNDAGRTPVLDATALIAGRAGLPELLAPISASASGESVVGVATVCGGGRPTAVWTGLRDEGKIEFTACTDWGGMGSGGTGLFDETDTRWAASANCPCATKGGELLGAHLYCFEAP
ncbi:MAG: hypothetical protein AAF721_01995 [Myxococcota bacterium]